MANELLLSASEVNLNLAGKQVAKALVAACTGLKRFLGDVQQVHVQHRPIGKVDDSAVQVYVDALEQALVASELDPVVAASMLSQLHGELDHLLSAMAVHDQRKATLSDDSESNSKSDERLEERKRAATFVKASELQRWVCGLPSELEQLPESHPARTSIKQGLAYTSIALAAAGTVAFASTPAGVAVLSAPFIAEAVKLAASHVFGKSTDKAWEKVSGARESLQKPSCPCQHQKAC